MLYVRISTRLAGLGLKRGIEDYSFGLFITVLSYRGWEHEAPCWAAWL